MKTALATADPVRVKWIGNQSIYCSPGFNGILLKVAHHDPNSIKVLWDEREDWMPKYTWERRKNLQIESDS